MQKEDPKQRCQYVYNQTNQLSPMHSLVLACWRRIPWPADVVVLSLLGVHCGLASRWKTPNFVPRCCPVTVFAGFGEIATKIPTVYLLLFGEEQKIIRVGSVLYM